MFITSSCGSFFAARWPVRTVVRVGLIFVLVAIVVLIGAIDPELAGVRFAVAMAVLGVGMGLLASQLGNAVQSSVDDADRSEAGGLQWTSAQLGSALGVAVIGSIVLTGLTNGFVSTVEEDERLDVALRTELVAAAEGGVDFLDADDVERRLAEAGLAEDDVAVVVDDYADAQLDSLRVGLLGAAGLALLGLVVTKHLPSSVPGRDENESDGAVGARR